MSLKVFDASYYKAFNYGAYDEGRGVVVANTESEALGICLESNEGTTADGWSFDEIDVNQSYDTVIIDSH